MKLLALETLPAKFYNEVMLGKEGREEQVKVYQEMIDNMDRAGINTLGYNWMECPLAFCAPRIQTLCAAALPELCFT